MKHWQEMSPQASLQRMTSTRIDSILGHLAVKTGVPTHTALRLAHMLVHTHTVLRPSVLFRTIVGEENTGTITSVEMEVATNSTHFVTVINIQGIQDHHTKDRTLRLDMIDVTNTEADINTTNARGEMRMELGNTRFQHALPQARNVEHKQELTKRKH